jgi:hypothetical protein
VIRYSPVIREFGVIRGGLLPSAFRSQLSAFIVSDSSDTSCEIGFRVGNPQASGILALWGGDRDWQSRLQLGFRFATLA